MLEPEVRLAAGGQDALPVLSWRLPEPLRSLSSAPYGGGLGLRRWVANAQVPASYDCRDPVADLAALAESLGLEGDGVGMLTAVDVRRAWLWDDDGVEVAATVGLGHPTWAADRDDVGEAGVAGTINVVAFVPAPLSDAALVNAVATVTEAKAQALWEGGVEATGTATDAVCILCPGPGGPAAEAYGGPRSTWGARLARAVHGAVRAGVAAWR